MGYRGDQGSAHFRSSSTSSEHGPSCFLMEEYTSKHSSARKWLLDDAIFYVMRNHTLSLFMLLRLRGFL